MPVEFISGACVNNLSSNVTRFDPAHRLGSPARLAVLPASALCLTVSASKALPSPLNLHYYL